jgi:hypothetical protein
LLVRAFHIALMIGAAACIGAALAAFTMVDR